MLGTVAVTDFGWYEFLSAQTGLSEVNFWTPSARHAFSSEPFAPFFFKLKAPHNSIAGFAFFANYSALPDWLAWECFGPGNGCSSLAEMRRRIQAIRVRIRYEETGGAGEIGCIGLVHPVFFRREDWIPQPADWHPRTVVSKRYDIAVGEGARIWAECQRRAAITTDLPLVKDRSERYGNPTVIHPRLGQGTFRIAVTDAYERACAVTNEHSLPALDAAHIRPFADDGPHDPRNGLLLRADIHRLFDKGYVTITPNFRLLVSPRLRADFHNGRTYYPLHESSVRLPGAPHLRPDPDLLRWHNENAFLG